MLSATLPVATWSRQLTLPVLPLTLGVGTIAYALFSIVWTPDQYNGIFAFWQYFCIAYAFVYGAQRQSLEGIAKGVALGLSVSSIIAISQALGFRPVLAWGGPAGLLFNSTILAECCVITILLLAAYRLWWWIPMLIPGLVLANSKGAMVALYLTAAAYFGRWAFLLAMVAIVLAGTLFLPGNSLSIRLALWSAIASHLSFFGHGIGSMSEVIVYYQGAPYAPEYAHNEFLDLAYQFGAMALGPIALLLAPLATRDNPCRYAYGAGAIICCYSFPLHTPLPAFLLACMAGFALRNWSLSSDHFLRGRYGLLRWFPHPQRPSHSPSGGSVSF